MDPDFIKRLREAFVEEAQEQLQIIRAQLVALEDDPDDVPQRFESLLRIFHSLKGSSRAVNLSTIEKSCQMIENVIIGHKSDSVLPRNLLDGLHEYVDAIQKIVANLEQVSQEDDNRVLQIAKRLSEPPWQSAVGLASGEFESLATTGQQVRLSAEM